MAIQNAIKLLKDVSHSRELRQDINGIDSHVELDFYLNNKGYYFSMAEFEESVNMLHVQCQTYEEANDLMQIAMWFRLLVGTLI